MPQLEKTALQRALSGHPELFLPVLFVCKTHFKYVPICQSGLHEGITGLKFVDQPFFECILARSQATNSPMDLAFRTQSVLQMAALEIV